LHRRRRQLEGGGLLPRGLCASPGWISPAGRSCTAEKSSRVRALNGEGLGRRRCVCGLVSARIPRTVEPYRKTAKNSKKWRRTPPSQPLVRGGFAHRVGLHAPRVPPPTGGWLSAGLQPRSCDRRAVARPSAAGGRAAAAEPRPSPAPALALAAAAKQPHRPLRECSPRRRRRAAAAGPPRRVSGHPALCPAEGSPPALSPSEWPSAQVRPVRPLRPRRTGRAQDRWYRGFRTQEPRSEWSRYSNK